MSKVDKINEYIRGQLAPGENIIGTTQAARVPPMLAMIVCALLLIPGIVLGLVAYAIVASAYGPVYLVATDQRLFVVHSNFNASMVWVKQVIAYANVTHVAIAPVGPRRKIEVIHSLNTARFELKASASGVDPVAAQRFLQEYPEYLQSTVAQIRANPQHPAHRTALLQPASGAAAPKKLSPGVVGYALAGLCVVGALGFAARVKSSTDEAASARSRLPALTAQVETARAARAEAEAARSADDARIGPFAAQYRPESDPIRQRSVQASVNYSSAEMAAAGCEGDATQGDLRARDNSLFASIALGLGAILGLVQWARNRSIRAQMAASASAQPAGVGFAPQPR